jgi:hypothetical protein
LVNLESYNLVVTQNNLELIYFAQFNLCLSPNQLYKSNLDLIWLVYYIKPVLQRVPTIIYSDHYNFHGYTAIYTTPSISLKKVLTS